MYQVNDPRVVPPPKDKVYTEMEALIQHFLIYSQGFTVPAGEAYVPVEGPRGEHGFYIVSDGTNRPVRVHLRPAVASGMPGDAADGRRRAHRRRHRHHRLDRHRHGRRGPVSFHPKMPYDERLPASPSGSCRAEGQPFAFTPERRAKFEQLAAHYPPERRKSAILYALFIVQEQQGYISANAMRHVAEVIGCTPAEVEDVVSYYAMFYRQPVGKYVRAGLPDAVVRAQGRRARDRGTVAARSASGRRDRRDGHLHADRGRVPRRVRPRAGRDGERRLARVPAPDDAAALLERLRASGEAVLSGCHHKVEK